MNQQATVASFQEPASPQSVQIRVRGGRRPLHAADFVVYAAIVGRAPTPEERDNAMTLARQPVAVDRTSCATSGGWIGTAGQFCSHIRAGIAKQLAQPHIAGWVRKLSGDFRR